MGICNDESQLKVALSLRLSSADFILSCGLTVNTEAAVPSEGGSQIVYG